MSIFAGHTDGRADERQEWFSRATVQEEPRSSTVQSDEVRPALFDTTTPLPTSRRAREAGAVQAAPEDQAGAERWLRLAQRVVECVRGRRDED